jgi:hypothetical protein
MSSNPENASPAWAGAARVISAENGYVTVTVPKLPVITPTRSSTPEPPYMWQNKEALRRIERTFDNVSSVALASALYYALTRIASDKQAEIFECKIKDIAAYMHKSYPKAREAIRLAEIAGVIRVGRRKIDGSSENAPSIYELLQIPPDQNFEPVKQGNKVSKKLTKVRKNHKIRRTSETIEVTEK